MDKSLRPSIFKRVLALLLDYIILGIVGFISGLFLEDFYVRLGSFGTLLGTVVTILYFGLTQSTIGKGQSLGKKAINAKVTDLNGEYLPLNKSLARAFIIYFPLMNVSLFTSSNSTFFIGAILVFITLTSIYFLFINKSRRCLHDVLLSSVVINEKVTDFDISEYNDKSKNKLIPIAVFAILMIAGIIYQSTSENTLSYMFEASSKIQEQEGVIGVTEFKSNTTTTYYSTEEGETGKTTSTLQIQVRIDNKEEIGLDDSKHYEEIYKVLTEEIHDINQMEVVSIEIFYGYDIGIASMSKSSSRTF